MAKTIELVFEYNILGTDHVVFQGKAYYESGKYDDIVITNQTISILGSRGTNTKAGSILINTNSTLYRQLLKSIVYIYLTQGNKFNLGKIEVKCGTEKETYPCAEIINPCTNDLPSELLITENRCGLVFSNKSSANDLLIAMMLFIKGNEDNDFDFLWKSFNSLYSLIGSGNTEFTKLKDMKSFIQTNQSRFIRMTKTLDSETVNNIRSLRIREFVLNNFDSISNTNNYAEMVMSFEDFRLNQLFNEIMPYREAFLKSKGLYTSVNMHIQSHIALGKKNNIDLLRFYILKYAYFLRNKYFHAEKSSPVFILRRNKEIEEIEKINGLMKILLADLFDCCELYIR